MTDELLPRLTEALADRYRIESELGQGGMATVYLAEDLKHDRQVAIKVLKPELAAVIGGDRFVTEIKTTASLQHPHILPLFDSGVADNFLYYVMPFVDGESLREKLDREKQLDVDEAVKIAGAVASALHYAHEQGIVHRDIKPANILIHAGEPVVADFGIALAISAAGGGRLTETGMSVGTPHYMSPEQASADRDVSARSDLYALACVLYEMLTGDPPHTGPTAQAVLMRILTEEPREVSSLRKSVPGNVADALAKALQKLPADRFKTADEFKRALTDADFTWRPKTRERTAVAAGMTPDATEAGESGWSRDFRTRVLIGANLLLLAVAGWALTAGGGAREQAMAGTGAVHRYVVDDSLRSDIILAISRKGDVAFIANDGVQHLRMRRAADTASVRIPGTTGGFGPVFSPDGEWLAFVTEGSELKKVQLATGTVVTLVAGGLLQGVFSSDWTEDGFVILSEGTRVHRVPDLGGEPELIADVGMPHFFADMLPGGRSLVTTVLPGGNPSNARLLLVDLPSGDTTTLADPGGRSVWATTGHILHGHPSGTVFAIPFDLEAGEVTGGSIPVRESVLTIGNVSLFGVSSTGSMVYLSGESTNVDPNNSAFGFMDLEGSFTALPLSPTDHADARLSPDGGRMAYTRDSHIYVFDLNTGSNQRFTFEGLDHHDPVWSPDGTRLAFSSNREGGQGSFDVWVKDVDGRSPAEHVMGTPQQDYAYDWTEDGVLLIHSRDVAGAQTDIWMARVDGGEEPRRLLEAEWDEAVPRISPDGTLMAYTSMETGDRHLFVREFPSMAGRWQISEEPMEGLPFWGPDGGAIYYRHVNGPVIRADVNTDSGLQVLGHEELFGTFGNLKDLTAEGDRFLASRPAGVDQVEESSPRLVVVANWFSELLERLGQSGPND